MDPLTGSLLLGGGKALLGGIFGGAEAKRQQQEANRAEKYNQMMGALNTQFSGLAPGLSRSQGIQAQRAPSKTGNIAKGILSGVQTGLSAYGALSKAQDNKDWGRAIKDKEAMDQVGFQLPQGGAGQSYGSMPSAYRQLVS